MITRASVRWRCRRGMRELDLLLQRFLDDGFSGLDEAGLECFEILLAEADQDILAWLSASRPPPRKLDAIVARIRRTLD